jgi:solute carrier family 30 (zinc transporter), member 5/7
MAAPDARTRNKITLNPHRIRSSSIPTHLLPQIFLSNVLFALALHAGKEWLLNFDVGIFWVTLRVLAFGGLVVLIKEGFTGELANKKSVEVCASFTVCSVCD